MPTVQKLRDSVFYGPPFFLHLSFGFMGTFLQRDKAYIFFKDNQITNFLRWQSDIHNPFTIMMLQIHVLKI